MLVRPLPEFFEFLGSWRCHGNGITRLKSSRYVNPISKESRSQTIFAVGVGVGVGVVVITGGAGCWAGQCPQRTEGILPTLRGKKPARKALTNWDIKVALCPGWGHTMRAGGRAPPWESPHLHGPQFSLTSCLAASLLSVLASKSIFFLVLSLFLGSWLLVPDQPFSFASQSLFPLVLSQSSLLGQSRSFFGLEFFCFRPPGFRLAQRPKGEKIFQVRELCLVQVAVRTHRDPKGHGVECDGARTPTRLPSLYPVSFHLQLRVELWDCETGSQAWKLKLHWLICRCVLNSHRTLLLVHDITQSKIKLTS